MNELELILRETGAAAEWPPTPDLVAGVRTRLAARAVRPSRLRLRRPLAVALAALLVVSGGAAAIPGVRDPVLDFLGVRDVTLERVPSVPHEQPAPRRPAFGARISLDSAVGRLGFRPVLPAGLGPPLPYYIPEPPGGQITLVYRRGALALSELRGHLDRRFFMKFIPPGTGVERVRVHRERGIWISGQVHELVYVDTNGEVRNDTARIVGNVLLWRRGPLLLRLEGARSKKEALRIAQSVRAMP
jgi:hypothetical protein